MFCNSWSIISAIALSLSEAFLNNSLSEMVHSDMDLCGVGETKLNEPPTKVSGLEGERS